MKRRRRSAFVATLVPKTPPVQRTPPRELVDEWLAARRQAQLEGEHVESIAIHWLETGADGRLRPHVWTANLSTQEEIGLAALMQAEAIERWKE